MVNGMKKGQGIHRKQIGNTDMKNMANKYETKTGNAQKTSRKHRQEKHDKKYETKTGNAWKTKRKHRQKNMENKYEAKTGNAGKTIRKYRKEKQI